MTFKERFFRGEIPFDEIDRYTGHWNFSDETCTLAQYLGLNAEEEDVWISQSDEALERLLEKEKEAYASCPVKILFTDLDGTLLDDQKQVSPANRDAIERALHAGHKIVLATGRALSSTLPIASGLGLDRDGCYIIAFNGGQIYDCHTGRFLLDRTLPLEYVARIFEEAAKAGIHCQTYEDEFLLSPCEDEEMIYYIGSTNSPCKIVEDIPGSLLKEPNKVLLIDLHDHQRLVDFRQHMQPYFEGRMDSMFSSTYYLEVVPRGVSKGNALHYLSNYLNIPMENTVAAGDSENDLPMILEAHIGAVLSNGLPSVKEQADYVTEKDNNHDGFAEIIDKFILN